MSLGNGLFIAVALLTLGRGTAFAEPQAELYRSTVIVTGQGEPNRLLGFRQCFPAVLVKVSGDQRLASDQRLSQLSDKAADYVPDFTYRDRLEGIPIHDEQGSYARPHDLTCIFRPEVIDGLLDELGSRPWPLPRPSVTAIVAVEHSGKSFVLSSDGPDWPYMRDSLAAATVPLALSVSLPDTATLNRDGLTAGNIGAASDETVNTVAKATNADVALLGRLSWSDVDLGWIAEWSLSINGKHHAWSVKGVSFDEAFRNAVRGAAQVLSGNGAPG